MTISFSHRSVYYVPGTNCSLCLGIDRDSSRHLGGYKQQPRASPRVRAPHHAGLSDEVSLQE